MHRLRASGVFALTLALAACAASVGASARQSATVLAGAQLTRVVPTGFYFEGLSAPTQMRNSAAVRLDRDRRVIAGMVDTSGYSSEIRAKYEGFFITDSPVSVGGEPLETGAYGFGFTDDGRLNVFDISGRQILSTRTTRDARMRRPRPLMMTVNAGEVRFYSGREYAAISVR